MPDGGFEATGRFHLGRASLRPEDRAALILAVIGRDHGRIARGAAMAQVGSYTGTY